MPAVQCSRSRLQTGGVWTECPSPHLETGLFACSGADMTCFLVTGTCDNFPTNNKSQRISQRAAGCSSCSFAAVVLLCNTADPCQQTHRLGPRLAFKKGEIMLSNVYCIPPPPPPHTHTHTHTHTNLPFYSLSQTIFPPKRSIKH